MPLRALLRPWDAQPQVGARLRLDRYPGIEVFLPGLPTAIGSAATVTQQPQGRVVSTPWGQAFTQADGFSLGFAVTPSSTVNTDWDAILVIPTAISDANSTFHVGPASDQGLRVGTTAIRLNISSGDRAVANVAPELGVPVWAIMASGAYRIGYRGTTYVGTSLTYGNGRMIEIARGSNKASALVMRAARWGDERIDDLHRIASDPWGELFEPRRIWVPGSAAAPTLTSVGQDAGASLNIRSAIGRDAAGALSITSSVGRDATAALNILAAAGADAAGSLAIRAAAGRDAQGSLNIVGSVGADAPAALNIRSAAGLDAPGALNIRSASGLDAPGSLNVRAPAGADAAGALIVRAPAGADAAGALNVRAAVGRDAPGALSILMDGSVGADAPGSLLIRGAVGADAPGALNIRGAVGTDAAGALGILQPVGADAAGSLTVRAAAGRDAAGTLVVRGSAGADADGSLVVRGAVGADAEASVRIYGATSGGSCNPDEIAAAVWAHIDEGLTARQRMRIVLAALAGRTTGAGTSQETFKAIAGDKTRIATTFDSDGNRATVTLDAT